MGATNDKEQVNQSADKQIEQHRVAALTNLQQYLAANPSVLSGAQAPQAPQQIPGTAQGGGTFGGPPHPAMLHAMGMQQPPAGGPMGNGQRPLGPPNMPAQAPGAQPPPGPPVPPPGMLGLMQRRPM